MEVAKIDTQVDYLQGETACLAPNWPFTSMVFAEQDILDRFVAYEGWRGPVRAAHVFRSDVPYWADVTEAMNEAVRRVIERGKPVKPVLGALHGKLAEAARRKGARYPPG